MAQSLSAEALPIRTTRLWLTPFTMDDAAAVYAYASIPEVSRYTTWRPHTSIRDAEDFLRYALGER
jgi:ribosomal-protein-alanine N-acetyltransferase